MSLPFEFQSQKRLELVRVAHEMLEARMDLIEGVRRICGLRHQVGDPDNPVFMPIRAIDSETDHFPIGQMREGCDAEYLQRVDIEMNSYLEQAREDLRSACREIILSFE